MHIPDGFINGGTSVGAGAVAVGAIGVSVRRTAETIQHDVMRDAIGFGSVKDLYEGKHFNHYLLEEDHIGAKAQRTPKKEVKEEIIDWDATDVLND